tara:strand:- start:612 stop:1163 length:552 start_codon:yes stop_codon:yes gene_type:complete
MKKHIIIIVSFLFVSNISAQSFGLKGGFAITNFVGSDSDLLNAESRSGIFLGAFVKVGEGNIEYMPEIIFNQKGAKEDGGDGTIVMNYLDLGVSGLFHINDELALVLGPYMGYLASGTEDGKSITDWDQTNRIEFGSNLGAIYNINDLLHLDLKYGIGFTDIFDEISMRNSSFQLGVGYIFGY